MVFWWKVLNPCICSLVKSTYPPWRWNTEWDQWRQNLFPCRNYSGCQVPNYSGPILSASFMMALLALCGLWGHRWQSDKSRGRNDTCYCLRFSYKACCSHSGWFAHPIDYCNEAFKIPQCRTIPRLLLFDKLVNNVSDTDVYEFNYGSCCKGCCKDLDQYTPFFLLLHCYFVWESLLGPFDLPNAR